MLLENASNSGEYCSCERLVEDALGEIRGLDDGVTGVSLRPSLARRLLRSGGLSCAVLCARLLAAPGLGLADGSEGETLVAPIVVCERDLLEIRTGGASSGEMPREGGERDSWLRLTGDVSDVAVDVELLVTDESWEEVVVENDVKDGLVANGGGESVINAV